MRCDLTAAADLRDWAGHLKSIRQPRQGQLHAIAAFQLRMHQTRQGHVRVPLLGHTAFLFPQKMQRQFCGYALRVR